MWVKVLLAWVLVVLTMVAGSSDWAQPTTLRHHYPTLLQAEEEDWRAKRTGPSLSVSNPIEVLRNRLLLEIARRRLQKQGEQNREFLKNIGKRHTFTSNRLLDPLDQDLEGSDYLLSNSGEAWEAS